MRVAIIGAGVSGLAAIKCCRDEGLDVVCFERRNDLGGVWNYTETLEPEQSNVTRSTVSNTVKELYCYSDFPMPGDFPIYPHHSKILAYLRMYADHFRLEQYIRFETKVVSIEQAPEGEGRWSVTTRKTTHYHDDDDDMMMMTMLGDSLTETFDAVMVCVGVNSHRNMPSFDGHDEFKGQLVHAADYRHADSFRDKRVVIVGVGNTACDAAVDLSSACSQVYLSARNGAWCAPRVWDGGLPLDLALFTRFTNSVSRLLPSRFSSQFQKAVNARFDHALYGLQPNHDITASSVIINDDLPSCIISGSVQVRPGIARLTSSGVQFTDGTHVDDIAAVICATGYSIQFSFLKDEALSRLSMEEVNLYKSMFAPDLQHQTLAIIGCLIVQGPDAPVDEMECRVAAKVFKGDICLPDSKTMWAEVRRRKAIHEAQFIPSANRYLFVDYISFMNDLSRMIGCTPPNFLRLLVTDPRLAVEVYFGLTTPYQYRLVGPGAWSGARRAILSARERILQPLKTRPVVIATTDNRRRRLFLFALIVGAAGMSAVMFYRRFRGCN